MANTKFDSRQIVNRSALSFVGSSANEILSTIFPKINDELAKLYEDRNIFLTNSGIITNTGGTSLSFTSNFILHINSNIAGAAPYTVSIGSSPWSFSADGRMAYITITSRSAGTFTLTTDATSLPAVTSANQEVFLIAKRVGTNIVLLGNVVVPSGASISLGSVSAGGADKQVQYNAGGTLAGSSNFIWDYTNNRLGIGISPSSVLNTYHASNSALYHSGDATTDIYAARSSTDALSPNIIFRKARNNTSSPTFISSGDTIGQLLFQVRGNPNYRNIAAIVGTVDTYTSDTDISSRLTFFTSPSGSATNVERMRIDPSGRVGIGLSPSFQLHVGSTQEWPISSRMAHATATARNTLLFQRSKDSLTSAATALSSGDFLGGLSFGGANGTIFTSGYNGGAEILAVASQNWSGAANGTELRLSTTTNGATSPTERMRIDHQGNVGIGTTSSANARVKISAGSGMQPLSLTHSDATSNAQILFEGAKTFQIGTGMASSGFANQLFFYDGTAAATRMIIDSQGNIGVGISPNSNWASLKSIDISNGVIPSSISSGGSSFFLSHNLYYNAGWKYATNNSASLIDLDNSSFTIEIFAPGTSGGSASTVNSSFSVSQSSMNYYSGLSSTSFYLRNANTGNGLLDGTLLGINSSREFLIKNQEAAGILFRTNNQTLNTHTFTFNEGGGEINMCDSSGVGRIFLDYYSAETAGRLLTNSGTALYLGSLGPQSVRLYQNSLEIARFNSAETAQSRFYSHAATASSSARIVDAQYAVDTNCTGGYFFTALNSSGSILAYLIADSNTTATWTSTSDGRLKQNFSNFNGLDIISNLEPKEFEWKSNPEKRVKGFIAQELVNVMPEAVNVGSDDLTEDGSLARPWGADYSKIVPVLVKAVQELSAENNQLKADIAEIKAHLGI